MLKFPSVQSSSWQKLTFKTNIRGILCVISVKSNIAEVVWNI